MIGFSARFSSGFFSLFRGIKLILAHPTLLAVAAVPFAVTLALLVAGVTWAMTGLSPLVVAAVSGIVVTGFWAAAVEWLALIIAWPAFLLLLFYAVFLTSKVISAPFHSLLAERALVLKGVIGDQEFNLGRWLSVSLKMMWISLLKALIMLPIGLLLFVLSFVPIVNVAAAFGVFLIVAFDSVDYSLEAMQLGLWRRFSYFRKNLPEFSGLAAALGLVLMVPGLNFFLFPAAVAGASDLVGRIEQLAQGRLKGNT